MPSIRRRGGPIVDEGLDIIPVSGAEPQFPLPPVAPPVDGLPPDLLNAPVGMDDDLAHALAARPQRSKLPGLTAFLVAAVLVAGGFVGGVITQKHEGGTSAGGGNTAALAAAFRNRGAGAGATTGTGAGTGSGAATGAGGLGAAAGGSGSTVGTVKLVDGNKIYLTTTDGATVVVDTGPTTTIKVTKSGVPADLPPGTTVVVQGTTGADGVVKATTVTQGGGAGGGFGGGGFGRTRTGTGTGTGGGAGATGGSGG